MTCTAVPTPADSPMTAYPPITRCSRCGALETAHELARDGRTRTVRLGQTAGSADNERCAGFVAGEAVELADAGELRRRLTAVLALHPELAEAPEAASWLAGYALGLDQAKRAGRGDS